MKLLLTAAFDGAWVLEHRSDDVLPVDNFLKIVNGHARVCKVNDTSFVGAEVIIEADSKEAALDHVNAKLAEIYGNALSGAGFSVDAKEMSDEQFEAALKADEQPEPSESESAAAEQAAYAERPEIRQIPSADRIETVGERAQKSVADPETRSTADKRVNDVLAEVDALAGSREFKALCHEVAAVAPMMLKNKTTDAFSARKYLFAVNDGCGLKNDLELFAKLVSAAQIKNMSSKKPVMECVLGPVKESDEPFENAVRMLGFSAGFSDGGDGQVLIVDISEWINNTDSRYFKNFLKAVAKQTNIITVFRVPYVDKFVCDRLYRSLNDILFVRSVVIPPYTQAELGEYAKGRFRSYGYALTKPAWTAFYSRLDAERADGRFYGLETVDKVVMELLYAQQVYEASHKSKAVSDCTNIGGKAAAAILEGVDSSEYGIESLKKLVGSEQIEKRINEIVAQIELSVKSGKDRPCIHMQFVGNPGTGKTTVARIVGKILKERGILSVGNFFEYSGRDFCGRYIGETAPKTAGMCRDAYGSVMFIDEAYSLFRGDMGDRDYGREALDTLIAEMENHRSDFVVIMAGYTDDMKTLMGGNAGLKSRMPYTIEFPNFTKPQLLDIFKSMSSDMKTENGLYDAAEKYFDDIPDEVINSKEFANARFVRNLFERTWAKASMRCQLNGVADITLTKDDFARAILDGEFKFESENKNRIGFRLN